jgi:hypothetical protein
MLAYTVGALAAILTSLFALSWFHLDFDLSVLSGVAKLGVSGIAHLDIGLRSMSVCQGGSHGFCIDMDVNFGGAYPTMAIVTFWASLTLAVVVLFQTARRVATDQAGEGMTRLGCGIAVICFVTAGLAGYLFAPEANANLLGTTTIHRTWSPALAMLGYGLAIQALRHAIAEHGLSDPLPSAIARSTPAVPREVRRMTPPEPARRAAVDSIPVSAEAEIAHDDPFAPPPAQSYAVAADVPDPLSRAFELISAAPPTAEGLRYATVRVHIGDAGLDGELDDGTSHRVAWAALVGMIARRLPAGAPYDGQTIVDVVSTAGATLRITPATAIDGEVFAGVGADRARAFLQVVAERCPTAKLDGATRAFVAGGDALQFPDADVLAQHDARVA